MAVKHYLLIIFLASLFFSSPSFSQRKLEKKIKRIETEASQLYDSRLWGEALDLYLLLDSLRPDNEEYQFRLGVIYYNSIDKAKSLKYFLDAIENGKQDPNLDFYLARAYHFNLDFNKAIQFYEKALSAPETMSRLSKSQRLEINKHIEDCKLAARYTREPLLTPIINIGEPINSSFPEYVPLLTADESMMIFTARRPNTTGKNLDQQGMFMEDVYISYRDAKGEWTEPDNDLKFNTKEHDACVGISPDGKKLILYRSENGGDLYISDFDGKKWTEPIALTAVNTSNWESSACLSADGQYLYFTSDKPGGLGGSDIYQARINENGEYTDIENLGPEINTAFDEDAPQIHSDGKTLFFSSKGHSGLGGYDIYSSMYDEEKASWEQPRNIGYPINTPDDDIYFSLLSNGAKGFFTSYRNDSYGEKDIYMITRPGSVPTKFLLKLKLIDPFSGNSIDAKVNITKTETGEIIELKENEMLQGKYVIPLDFESEYIFGIEASGYKFKEKKINIDYRADIFEYVMNIVPNREEIITLVDSVEYLDAIKKAQLTSQIYTDDQLASEQKSTDQGKNLDNLTSSPDDRNIQDSNIRTVTENQTYRSYKNVDLNNKINESRLYRNRLINSIKLSEDENWIKRIMNNESHVIFLTRLDTRNKVVIPIVNFRFDEYTVSDEYQNYLKGIADFLVDNSSTNVLIAGHTDWIGTIEYNKELSIKRAKLAAMRMFSVPVTVTFSK